MAAPSIDSMLGIINNSHQTANIIDNQRSLADSIKNSMERNAQNIASIVNTDGDRIINSIERNDAFANQNLNAIDHLLKIFYNMDLMLI